MRGGSRREKKSMLVSDVTILALYMTLLDGIYSAFNNFLFKLTLKQNTCSRPAGQRND